MSVSSLGLNLKLIKDERASPSDRSFVETSQRIESLPEVLIELCAETPSFVVSGVQQAPARVAHLLRASLDVRLQASVHARLLRRGRDGRL